MWASFGYFDAATNEHVLASFGRRLRPGGRLVLDLFNRAYFERGPAEVERRDASGHRRARATASGARRHVELDYGDGHVDRFEWQLYRPEELERSLVPEDSGSCSCRPPMMRRRCNSSSSATPSHP